MKLKRGFVTHQMGDKQIMVAAGAAADRFHGMVRSNETAAFIVNCLKEETSQESIVEAMAERYDAPREKIQADVARVLAQLQSIGAIE